MELIVLPSDIARLVLEYLKKHCEEHVVRTYCENSPYLGVESRAYEKGFMPFSFMPTLEDIISEYVKISQKVVKALGKIPNSIKRSTKLTKLSEKIEFLLNTSFNGLIEKSAKHTNGICGKRCRAVRKHDSKMQNSKQKRNHTTTKRHLGNFIPLGELSHVFKKKCSFDEVEKLYRPSRVSRQVQCYSSMIETSEIVSTPFPELPPLTAVESEPYDEQVVSNSKSTQTGATPKIDEIPVNDTEDHTVENINRDTNELLCSQSSSNNLSASEQIDNHEEHINFSGKDEVDVQPFISFPMAELEFMVSDHSTQSISFDENQVENKNVEKSERSSNSDLEADNDNNNINNSIINSIKSDGVEVLYDEEEENNETFKSYQSEEVEDEGTSKDVLLTPQNSSPKKEWNELSFIGAVLARRPRPKPLIGETPLSHETSREISLYFCKRRLADKFENTDGENNCWINLTGESSTSTYDKYLTVGKKIPGENINNLDVRECPKKNKKSKRKDKERPSRKNKSKKSKKE